MTTIPSMSVKVTGRSFETGGMQGKSNVVFVFPIRYALNILNKFSKSVNLLVGVALEKVALIGMHSQVCF